MRIDVRRELPSAGMNLPAAVSRTTADITREAPDIITREIRNLSYDSLRTIDELLSERPDLIQSIAAIAEQTRPTDSRATPDLQDVIVSFEIDLNGELLPALVSHDRPVTIRGKLGWIPTTEYTGIVIYAADELPLHGTDVETMAEPALLPGIYYYSENGDGVERLMEADYLDPGAIRERGAVLYTSDVQMAEFSERVGRRPLRIVARGLFGRYPTDPVIGFADAEQILATESNRALVRDGRIAIVLSPSRL